MPIYEYKCNVCGETEELLEDLSSIDCHTCNVCGLEKAMQRQCSAPSVNTITGTCGSISAESPSCKGSGCNCPFAR